MTSHLVPALRRTIVAAVLAAAPAVAAGAADDLDLKRVVLSTGGVAYLEYEATVDGDSALAFDVRLDQVDDVLKSFIVLDDTGGVGTVTLPGRQPLDEIFRDLPFAAAALSSTVALLQALAGEEVEVEGNADVSGRILSVVPETVALDGGATTTRHRLTLATDDGLRQAIVEDSTAIRFTDPALQDQVANALAALAGHRIEDRRTLTLQATGEAERTVRLGYVVEAPLWKTTYRLALGEGPTALLQGWATLENMTGQDWDGVELTLVSGNPVTFRQALYESYWVDRPWVPVDVAGRVVPMVDSGAMRDVLTKAQEEAFHRSAGEASEMLAMSYDASVVMTEQAAPAPTQMANVGGAASEDAATQVVFRIADPVTVAAGDSLSVPIVSRQVPAERIALYQPQTDPRHPLAAVRLTNDSGAGLPPGVVTIYEPSTASGGETFVGDARLGTLPAGEERLVAFALDQRTLVDREDKHQETIGKLGIDRGVLTATLLQRQTTLYAVQAPAGEALDVIIEHPRQPGWELVAPAGEVETTDLVYRLPLAVPAGGAATLEVALELPRDQVMQLVNMGSDQILWFADNGEVPQEMRAVFRRIAELRAAVEETGRALDEANRQRGVILEEQDRLRRNLESVPSGSDLASRYLTKLAEQEDLIEEQLDRIDTLEAQREERRRALQDFIAGIEM